MNYTPLDQVFHHPVAPQIDPDAPVFDAGDGAVKEPMTLAELEAKIPEWNARQKKFKLAPNVVYTREMHREEDSKYYSRRPRSTGSETQRRSVNRVSRAVGDHGAHSIRGAYGAFKDAPADEPQPTYQPAPEATIGYCHECRDPIPRVGMRTDAKFCCEAHSKAFRRREAVRQQANRAFKDWHESAQAKAEAVLSAEAYHVAAAAMQDSAARAGIGGAAFFATPAGVMGRADDSLPPIRLRAISNTDHPRYGAWPVDRIVEVQTSDVPEYGAVLYTFDFPARQFGEIGLVTGLEARFLGDPGTGWDDGYLTPEQEEANASEAEVDAQWYIKWRAREARQQAARARPTSARQAHAEERMRNLLARPDHDVIIADFEEG